jgi:hypothetical protein
METLHQVAPAADQLDASVKFGGNEKTMNKLIVLWIVSACIGLCWNPALARAEQLLSRNATYRIYGAGYCYPGQVQPGVNQRAKKGSFLFTPLVEQTDRGDLLIDGNTGDESIVYTPWVWSRHWKIIVIEMKLPGPSQVSRVEVHLPHDVEIRAESATLFLKSGDGTWQSQGNRVSESGPPENRQHQQRLTFGLQDAACQELKIVMSGDRSRMGLAEIEVFGEGPIEKGPSQFADLPIIGRPKVRGLIRSKPHLETMDQPKLHVSPGDLLLTKPGQTTVTLSGDTLTDGKAEMLVDGDPASVVRVDKPPHSHFTLTAELDLGGTSLISAVNVRMPGGQGTQTGHLHDLTLAIGSGAEEGAVWYTPVDLIENPYWPTDDAPPSYPIPINNLNVIGRHVRITATLMGTGGVTNRLALAEIEVWGKPAERSAQQVVRLDKQPIEIEPRPVGELHPKWRWLKKHKLRAAWMGDNLAAKFPGTDKTKGDVLTEAGFNLVRVSGWLDRKNRDVSPYMEQHLAGDVQEARRVGIPLFVGWQYGSNHLEPYRKYRAPSGVLNDLTCCPLDGDYIDRHVGRWAVAIARGGADGMLIDTEMYQSDQTAYPGPCLCDDCFSTYLETFTSGSEILYDQVPAERRGLWLSANEADRHYLRFQDKRIIALYDGIRQQCQAINPAFLFAHAPGTRHLSVIMQGLGTPRLPCLAFAELEYYTGPTARSAEAADTIPKNNIPALYICGLWCSQQNPRKLADNAVLSSLYYDGWWLYYAEGILTHPSADDPEAFHSHGRVEGTTARAYLDQITASHHRLDELLGKPREQWPKREQ